VFRHTFASMHVSQGTDIVQLSRLLGHHSPSFTLSTYAHLMDDDLGSPITLPGENKVGPTRSQRTTRHRTRSRRNGPFPCLTTPDRTPRPASQAEGREFEPRPPL
jgi:hypothetical protein